MRGIIKYLMLIAVFLPVLTHASKRTSVRFNGTQENELAFQRAVDYGNFDNMAGKFRWGVNSLTNLRVRADVGEFVTFNLAINVNLLSGVFTDGYKALYLAHTASQMVTALSPESIYNTYFGIPFYYKSTYIGGFELERVSFSAGNMYFTFEMGLMRLARGFGYAFSPTDYFNPKNPYNQKGRPEGKLAMQTVFYPGDMWKITAFAVAPDNPLESEGWGVTTGFSTMFNLGKFNFEFSYSFLLPEIAYEKDPVKLGLPETARNDFSHIAGFSMKADIEIGFFIDAVYRFEHKAFRTGKFYNRDFKGYDGLEAALGIDYTLPGGKVYLLTEYLFYGPAALTWGESLDDLYSDNENWYKKSLMNRALLLDTSRKTGNFLRHNYLFNMIRVQINDYVGITGSAMLGLDDISAVTSVNAEIAPVQALSIGIGYSNFIDRSLFHKEFEKGELGSKNTGVYNMISITSRIRF